MVHGILRNGIFLLDGAGGIGLRPAHDHRDARSPFVTAAFAPSQGSYGADFLKPWNISAIALVDGSVSAVVGHENDQRPVGHAQFLEVIHQIPQGFVHAADQGAEIAEIAADGNSRFKGRARGISIVVPVGVRLVVPLVDGVMGHVREERRILIHGGLDLLLHLQRQGICQEIPLPVFRRSGSVIFLQVRNMGVPGAELILSTVGGGLSGGAAGYVDVKSQVGWIGIKLVGRGEVGLSHRDSPVAGILQHAGERNFLLAHPGHVPLGSTDVGKTAAVFIQRGGIHGRPVGDPVTGGGLARHQGRAARRTQGARIGIRELHPLRRQPFHGGRFVKGVQLRNDGLAVLVIKWHGRILPAHVVHQEHQDVGRVLRQNGNNQGLALLRAVRRGQRQRVLRRLRGRHLNAAGSRRAGDGNLRAIGGQGEAFRFHRAPCQSGLLITAGSNPLFVGFKEKNFRFQLPDGHRHFFLGNGSVLTGGAENVGRGGVRLYRDGTRAVFRSGRNIPAVPGAQRDRSALPGFPAQDGSGG